MHLVTQEVISGKQKVGLLSTGTMIDIPIINRYEYQLIDIPSDDDFMHLMNSNGEIFQHIKVPENELGEKNPKNVFI